MEITDEALVNWEWEYSGQVWGFDPRRTPQDSIGGIENFAIPDDTVATIVTAHHWKVIRLKRDALLLETDWWAMSDRTMTSDQTSYRQSLRDITTQSDPDDITWPTKPT
jgi:hypothetical protein